MKINRLLIKEDTSTKICQTLKNKIAQHIVITFYSLAKLYKLGTVSKLFLALY